MDKNGQVWTFSEISKSAAWGLRDGMDAVMVFSVDIVQDTNVFVAALRSKDGASAEVLSRCLKREDAAWLGQSLFAEYEEKVMDADLWKGVPITRRERQIIFDGFCAVAHWQPVWFLWRPNLPDPDDDHVYELALAAGVERLVTHNTKDFQHGEALFQQPEIVTPAQHLKTL